MCWGDSLLPLYRSKVRGQGLRVVHEDLMVGARHTCKRLGHRRPGPRLSGLTMLLTVTLLWQLYGCMTPANERQSVNQLAEPSPQIRLSWDPPTTRADGNPLVDIAGYKIHYGERSRTYTFTKIVGNQTSAGISGLVPGRTYFFAITTYDSAGNESRPSDEMSVAASQPVSQIPVLMQDPMIRGQSAQFWVVGAQPGEVVSFLSSQSGEGEGPCSPQLGGLCVDLLEPSVFGEATADDSATATLTQVIPMTAALDQTISIQAVIRRGLNGVDSVKTNAITSRVMD